jgi:hypothetical protein
MTSFMCVVAERLVDMEARSSRRGTKEGGWAVERRESSTSSLLLSTLCGCRLLFFADGPERIFETACRENIQFVDNSPMPP